MARIELTIDAEWCPEWGIWEGCREFVQNTLDGHDRGHQMSIEHRDGVLTLVNRGIVLSRDVLLLGNSSKRKDDHQRGQWGEGLDLGILAMVRAGRQVKIRNGGETWTPVIVQSDKFDAQVPAVFTRRVSPGEDYIAQLEVTEEEWQLFLPRFLDLSPCESIQVKRDGYQVGSILTSEERAGSIYCKGIWVQTRDDLKYGYDLTSVQLDRDRKMPSEYSLRSQVASIWIGLIAGHPGFAARAFEVLGEDGLSDCNFIPETLQYDTYSEDARSVPAKMAEVFDRHHAGCLPVAEQGHLVQLSHYGRSGIMVPRKLSRILERHYGSFSKIMNEVSRLSFVEVQLRELSEHEERVYWRGLGMFCHVGWFFRHETLERLALQVHVVNFQDDSTLAAFDPGKMTIYVARKMLVSVSEFIGSIIHEKAHEYTMAADGSLIQAQVERQMWRELTRLLVAFVPKEWPDLSTPTPEPVEVRI